ncbi:hypothetical protein K435DRAFT_809517 [Dendrothele bispora CBS 962.96]|uniref:Uncharacterized protein n=1 Tax=Dendrothele bispora (strain CBS 962.96) TaxID=1314807 RepID=A0A4S8KY84_DENBC|nr:hypothetical protein K435DRAFT_809517 [Dendrothele bispora CBS 962.96]
MAKNSDPGSVQLIFRWTSTSVLNVNVGTGGTKNLESHQKSKACVAASSSRNAPKFDRKLNSYVDQKVTDFFKKKPTLVPFQTTAPAPILPSAPSPPLESAHVALESKTSPQLENREPAEDTIPERHSSSQLLDRFHSKIKLIPNSTPEAEATHPQLVKLY